MPPDDPFGRHGPSLDTFLKIPTVVISPNNTQPCPYGKKCTYGNKCKFFHADRGNIPMKTVTDKLKVVLLIDCTLINSYCAFVCSCFII